MGGRGRRRNELSRFVDMDGATDGQAAVCGGVSVDLLKSTTDDTLGDSVGEAELTGAARFWLTVFGVGEVSTTDSFDIADLIVG